MGKEPENKEPVVAEAVMEDQLSPPGQLRADGTNSTGDQPTPPQATPTTPQSNTQNAAHTYHSRALAETVINSFVDRLNEESRRKGGYLTTQDIATLSQEFHQKTEALEKIFQQSLEQYVLARERAAFDHARQFPFDRVIVSTFAHLFDPERVADEGEFAVTRLVLPGFFLAVDKMLGPEMMEGYQERCKAIVERLSPGSESVLDWEQVYGDPETMDLCCDALVAMAPYFADLEKRKDWFVALVNGNLSAQSDWQLTNQGFYNLSNALFTSLREALQDPARRLELTERHGKAVCDDLDAAFITMNEILGEQE